ncbi:MAG: hypothetical protein INQ03_06865 [Candidatus Heimdallarchaeota archaeon]|nr:hypothetical protein [Candidatus Heimdallarchaeota archaeon]
MNTPSVELEITFRKPVEKSRLLREYFRLIPSTAVMGIFIIIGLGLAVTEKGFFDTLEGMLTFTWALIIIVILLLSNILSTWMATTMDTNTHVYEHRREYSMGSKRVQSTQLYEQITDDEDMLSRLFGMAGTIGSLMIFLVGMIVVLMPMLFASILLLVLMIYAAILGVVAGVISLAIYYLVLQNNGFDIDEFLIIFSLSYIGVTMLWISYKLISARIRKKRRQALVNEQILMRQKYKKDVTNCTTAGPYRITTMSNGWMYFWMDNNLHARVRIEKNQVEALHYQSPHLYILQSHLYVLDINNLQYRGCISADFDSNEIILQYQQDVQRSYIMAKPVDRLVLLYRKNSKGALISGMGSSRPYIEVKFHEEIHGVATDNDFLYIFGNRKRDEQFDFSHYELYRTDLAMSIKQQIRLKEDLDDFMLLNDTQLIVGNEHRISILDKHSLQIIKEIEIPGKAREYILIDRKLYCLILKDKQSKKLIEQMNRILVLDLYEYVWLPEIVLLTRKDMLRIRAIGMNIAVLSGKEEIIIETTPRP